MLSWKNVNLILKRNICHKKLEVRNKNLEEYRYNNMNEFKTNTIDISTLPKFEETTLNPLQKDYFKVMLIQFGIVFGILLIGIIALYIISIEELIKDKIIYFL